MTDLSNYSEYGGDEHPPAEFRARAATHAAPAAELTRRWHLRSSAQVFLTPYAEPDALVPALQLARGRPMGVVGPPGAGKNDFTQALALAVASGVDAFSLFPVARRGRVIHITYDMGDWATRIRYRRLANGMRLSPAQVEDRITLAPYPEVNLTSASARAKFAELLSGFDLAVLDNARAASPGLDENSSVFGERIVLFGQACEDAGCVGCYLHHSRKSNREREEEVTIESLRGTSAIAGASGAVWYIAPTAGPDSPRICRMLRTHDVMPELGEDFYLHHVPATGGEFDTGVLNPIRLVGSYEAGKPAAPGAATQDLHSRVLAHLRFAGDAGVRELVQACGCRHEAVRAVLDELLQVGAVLEFREGTTKRYAIVAKV